MLNFDFLDMNVAYSNCMDSDEFLMEMLQAYVEESRLTELMIAYNDKDYKTVGTLAHSVKSQSKIIGATKVSELGYSIEKASDDNDIEFINATFKDFIKAYTELINKVKEVI